MPIDPSQAKHGSQTKHGTQTKNKAFTKKHAKIKYHKFFLQSFSKVSSIFLYFSKIGMGILAMRGEMEKGSKGLHLVFNSLDKS